MAKGKGKESGENMPHGNVKMADIKTAAASTMEPRDYEKGYPSQPGRLRNENFADHKRTKGEK
jgi:hypothetical protein